MTINTIVRDFLERFTSKSSSQRTEFDDRLDRFYELWSECAGNEEEFEVKAQKELNLNEEDIAWIHSAIGSAQFRVAFGKSVGSHKTNFENDPWFLAAQRRFRASSSNG